MATVGFTEAERNQMVVDYLDNADYDSTDPVDLTKARAYRVACRKLLRTESKKVRDGAGREIEIDPVQLRQEINAVTAAINEAANSNPSVTYPDFSKMSGRG